MNDEDVFSILVLVGCWNDSRQYQSCTSQSDIVLLFFEKKGKFLN